MRRLTRLQKTVRSLFRRKQTETDLDQELRYHLEQEIENNIRAGMEAEEAKFAAQRLIGPLSLYKEECRDARGAGLIENILRDLRYAVRMLRRTPLFTVVAMATLAIGIGANTAVFTFIENILLRSLPIHDPEQVDSLAGETLRTHRTPITSIYGTATQLIQTWWRIASSRRTTTGQFSSLGL